MTPAQCRLAVVSATLLLAMPAAGFGGDGKNPHDAASPEFQTSDRCIACHNGLTTPKGEDVSIGFDWRASIMANSARDPYWQASVRRETLDHPEATAAIQDECATCHMPMARYHAKTQGERGEVFAHLAAGADSPADHEALDGVSCSVCHQVSTEGLGTDRSFNGGFIIKQPTDGEPRPEFGPFDMDLGLKQIMRTSTGGFEPTRADHIRQSQLCATCHTLHTSTLGPGGKIIGTLPEQVPYQEWLHSSFADKQSCQSCHMPVVDAPVAISRVLGEPRTGMSRHVFVAANFFIQHMLNRYRDDLDVQAQPQELTAAADRTIAYLQSKAAQLSIENASLRGGRAELTVHVENLGGHRLPTAFPSRRAWLHVVVTDAQQHKVFESGALNPDGSIQGNDNDADRTRYEPHYAVIRSPDQVQIYEAILKDTDGQVTTGLLSAVGYAKDNRLLPHGFDKATAEPDIAVHGEAASDAAFTDLGHRLRYSIATSGAQGPLRVAVELWYQPIGYRWASSFKKYDADEPKRFTEYFDSMKSESAVELAHTQTLLQP